MSSSKFSEVWQHFLGQGKAATCQYCSKVISISNGSTSNLKRHLKNKHPSITFHARNQEPIAEATTPSTSWDESSTVEAGTAASKPARYSSSTGADAVTSKPLGAMQKSRLDEALLDLICDECLPFNIVEGEAFKRFIRLLNPKYDLPHRRTISDGLLSNGFQETLARVTENVAQAQFVAITLDSWTNAHGRYCLAVTAHYINDDFNLVSNLLACNDCARSPQAAGRDITEWINQLVVRFKVQNKIQALVTDNVTDAVKDATSALNVEHLPCFAHTLNLVVQNALRHSIQETVDEIQQLVSFFQTNTSASERLAEAQAKLQMPYMKLKQAVPSRWNSTFDMMDRFLRNKDPILACLDGAVEHNLQFNDWIILEQSVKVLVNFDHATKVLTTDKSVTLSQTGLLPNILLTKTQAALHERMEFPVKTLATCLIEELSKRCKPYLDSKLVCRAMILDPRMKGHSFADDRQRYEATYQSLIASITPLKVSAAPPPSEPTVAKPFADPSHQSLFSDFATSIKRVKNSAQPEVAAKLELDEYLKMDCIELTEDPLLWWKTYKSQFPALCQIVQKLFCIPATSVPPERIFSKDGEMYAAKRAQLLHGKMSEVLFLRQNSKYLSPQ
uniref:Uncharacterized protein n=1 Tax=Anopheles stephensi TaxID=30069 RepID=A0A182YFM1_ANOST